MMHCICVYVYVYVFIYLAGCSLSYRVKTLRSLLSSGDAGTAQAHKGRARIAQPDITRGHTGGASEVYPCAPPPPPVHLTRVETSNKSQSLQAPGSRAPADSPQKLAARRTQLLKRVAELNAEKSGLEAEVASAKHGLQTTGMLQRELRVELERTVRQSHECDCMVLDLTRAEKGCAGLGCATSAAAEEQLTVPTCVFQLALAYVSTLLLRCTCALKRTRQNFPRQAFERHRACVRTLHALSRCPGFLLAHAWRAVSHHTTLLPMTTRTLSHTHKTCVHARDTD